MTTPPGEKRRPLNGLQLRIVTPVAAFLLGLVAGWIALPVSNAQRISVLESQRVNMEKQMDSIHRDVKDLLREVRRQNRER